MAAAMPTTQHFITQDRGVLSGFHVEQILSDSDRTKSIAVLGSWPAKPGKAVLLLSRRPFDQSAVQHLVDTSPESELQFQNDVYAKYTSTLAPDQGAITVDTIYPASEKHISKHTSQKFLMVAETPALYYDKVLPFIQAVPAARRKWVYNILDKKAEVDRLLFEDPNPELGFMLHPDLKWVRPPHHPLHGSNALMHNQKRHAGYGLAGSLSEVQDQKQIEGLYCIALCNRKDIHSLRDLNAEHLPLLTNIKHQACKAIADKYGMAHHQIRAYIHYHPSYYHFHVHFMHVNVDAGAGMSAGKAHLLDDVIDNLKTCSSDYYSRRTLHFTLGENDPLYQECFADSVPPIKRQKH